MSDVYKIIPKSGYHKISFRIAIFGCKIGCRFEFAPKLRFAGYKFFITIGRCSWSLVLSQIYYNFGTKIHKTVLKKLNYCQFD